MAAAATRRAATAGDGVGFVCVNDILNSFLEACDEETRGEAEPGGGSSGGGASGCSHPGGGSGGGGGDGQPTTLLGRMRRLEGVGRRFAQRELRHLSCKGCDGDFLHSRHAGEATLLELVFYGFLDPKRRSMTSEHFGALALPVGEFLALEHDTEYVAANRERLLEEPGVLGSPAHDFIRSRNQARSSRRSGGEPEDDAANRQPSTSHDQPTSANLLHGHPPVGQRLIVATANSTFGEVVGLLVRHRVHRVYVVDERGSPVGIVTCTDVLRKVVELATGAASPSAVLPS
ncbi:hypothetical protein GPECTOR_101g37 [Gonium pectorale]|uniref:CBS domain-containing protein n=1 Tax=Gonium pectorale TaxID=33097 RepID=A0A150FZT6_GONPE|nr:hypothetical protein GPECTOR_101g37 [Gonium pectorale]|eukprot:KXZ43136.1 hypothetical protein GPECTOR_101g37 [Gonium pectorale]